MNETLKISGMQKLMLTELNLCLMYGGLRTRNTVFYLCLAEIINDQANTEVIKSLKNHITNEHKCLGRHFDIQLQH